MDKILKQSCVLTILTMVIISFILNISTWYTLEKYNNYIIFIVILVEMNLSIVIFFGYLIGIGIFNFVRDLIRTINIENKSRKRTVEINEHKIFIIIVDNEIFDRGDKLELLQQINSTKTRVVLFHVEKVNRELVKERINMNNVIKEFQDQDKMDGYIEKNFKNKKIKIIIL